MVAALPGIASAIGFGNPSIDSYLGEPLRVRVPLLSVQDNDLDELRVSLAAKSWYQAAGLEYPDIADQLLVGLDLQSIDEPAVVVTTTDAVNQIMVPLVLELSWPTRVMRNQLSVLLNPVEYQPTRIAEDLLATEGLVEAAGTIGINPSATAQDDDQIQDPLPISDEAESISAETSTTEIETVSPTATEAVDGNSAVIPDKVLVKAGDSLSTIVDRFLPSGANRYQGRIAFYDANPEAFQGGEIHHLIEGAELQVPVAETILGVPPEQARSRYVRLAEVVPQWVDNATEDNIIEPEPVNDGFRLSLIELPEQDLDVSQNNSETRVLQSGQLNAVSETSTGNNNLIADAAADITEPGFEMQGFSMKLTVMNAYIVELQDENRQLKERVNVLEQQVERLVGQIGRDTGVAMSDPFTANEVNLAQINSGVESALPTQQQTPVPDLEALSEQPEEAPADQSSVITEAVDQLGAVEQEAETPEPSAAEPTTVDHNAVQSQPVSDQLPQNVESSPIQSAAVTQDVVAPRVIFRQGLLERAKSILGPLNNPIVQLVLAILMLGFMLLAWMLRKERKQKHRQVEVIEQDVRANDVPYTEGEGVRYEVSESAASLDLNDTDEPWSMSKELSEADLDNLQESAVDPITQSEVYLTYNRPQQAIEVLWEEYAKPDSDKYVVAKRILKVYLSMGDNEHRNASMRNFIVTLNDDIEIFSSEQWEELRQELDTLRKSEQAEAVEGVERLDSDYQLDSKESESIDERTSPELPHKINLIEELDDGLIDLEYDVSDEAQAR
jgi:cell division protein FtsB